jgi:hypothetical protein
MTVQDLREALRERADGPSPANPSRHEQVLARVRRARLGRRVTAGVAAGAAVAAAVVLGAAVMPGPAEPETTVAVRPAAKLPERFTAPDGTAYRRVAVTTIRAGGADRATVRVPVTGERLDVAAVCEGDLQVNTGVRVAVDGRSSGPGFGRCSARRALQPLTVPTGAREVSVTFDTTTTGTACVVQGGTCRPVPRTEGTWTLGVYAWTPPDAPVRPEPVKDLPDRLGGRPLLDSRTGMWPADDTVRFEFDATGRSFGLDQICAGDLAERLRFEITVDGGVGHGSGCVVWRSGPFPLAMSEHKTRPGERVVVTARITVDGGHPHRPVRWSIGLYGE